jgi:type II restriction/modification system DNA methylase subunit YeeA
VPVEASWPKANVVIGNPPFLGDRKMIRELGEAHTATLRRVYEGRVPGGADLVCYWFEKARTAIQSNHLFAAGLVTTNSIRGGKNRAVLDAIAKTTHIFEAWSDEGWVNDGAAVRVSLVAFGHATQSVRLNGIDVNAIATDLSAQDLTGLNDLTSAAKLPSNASTSFIGTQKNGPFDIPRSMALDWLRLPNPNGKSNALVIRPWANGLDVTRRPQDRWVVDFGCEMPQAEAALFETPFSHIEKVVKPTRAHVRRDWHREHWWLFGDARPGLREKLSPISRFIVTPMVAKHRVFAWLPAIQMPENLCVAITRADDTTFGILHSRFHELWSLRMCTWLGVGNDPRYTPTTCFETFPFPAGLTPADTAHQRTETLADGAVIPENWGLSAISPKTLPASGQAKWDSDPKFPSAAHMPNKLIAPVEQAQAAINNKAINTAVHIAQAAKRLNDLRENWLNPPEWTHKVPEVTPLGLDKSPYPDRIEPKPGISEVDLKALQKRTLTNLYNAKPAWLTMAHQQLDKAVAAAYGWVDYTADMPDDEILKRLLALNLARSATISPSTQTPKP